MCILCEKLSNLIFKLSKKISQKLAYVTILISVAFMSGCTILASYSPKKTDEQQIVSYSQGVGAISIKDSLHEIAIYPTFRTQSLERPTFNISFANNGYENVEFGIENIKAYFRGAPVNIYSYSDRIIEIETHKRATQVFLAVLGGVAAGAAAYGASRQTYRQNYSGSAWNSRGRAFRFQGSNTIRSYDPLSGIIAGGAVMGATAYGINQLEYSAESEEAAASSILQINTVAPQQMVSGQIILKECCDPFESPNDTIQIDVDVAGKTNSFAFTRLLIKK